MGQSEDDCYLCPPGQYCANEANVLPDGPCDAGHFCVLGSATATPQDYDEFLGGQCGGYQISALSLTPNMLLSISMRMLHGWCFFVYTSVVNVYLRGIRVPLFLLQNQNCKYIYRLFLLIRYWSKINFLSWNRASSASLLNEVTCHSLGTRSSLAS